MARIVNTGTLMDSLLARLRLVVVFLGFLSSASASADAVQPPSSKAASAVARGSIAEDLAFLRTQTGVFDPFYDEDSELESRRRLAGRYVPYAEFSKWTATNSLQLRIQRRIEKAAQRLSTESDERASDLIRSASLPEPLATSLRAEILFCRMTNAPASNQGMANESSGRSIEQLCSLVSPLSKDKQTSALLARRYLRKALSLPFGWRPNQPWSEAKTFVDAEGSRFEPIEVALLNPGIRESQTTWFRVAKTAGMLKQAVSAASNLLSRAGTAPSYERIGPMFKSGDSWVRRSFSIHRSILLTAIENDASMAVLKERKEVRKQFAADLARLCRMETKEEFKELDDQFMIQICLETGAMGELNEALANRSLSPSLVKITDNGVPAPPPKVELPDAGHLEPYPASPALQAELDRYQLEAGWFVQPSSSNPAATNRIAFLLHSPRKGAGMEVPLLLFLPGAGELGSDLSRQFNQRGIFEKVTSDEFQKKHPCYLLVLSPPEEGSGSIVGYLPGGKPTPFQQVLHDALLAVARTRKRPSVDSRRIYATGLSYGGAGAYGISFVYPGLFAAAVPVSSMVFESERIPESPPCNYFHLCNEGDHPNQPLLDAFGARVRELGGDFRVGTFPNEGHNAWDAAWKEDAMWDWMFSKRRGANGAAARATGRVPDPTRSIGGGEENHAENAGSAEVRPPAVTASKPGRDARTGPERALDGLDGTAYVSASPVSAGDWLQVEWSAPVQGRIEVRTGLSDGTLRLSKGRVEVSVDGRVWSRTGTVSQKTGVCAFGQRTGIRFLRLIPEPRVPEPLAVREIAVKP